MDDDETSREDEESIDAFYTIGHDVWKHDIIGLCGVTLVHQGMFA